MTFFVFYILINNPVRQENRDKIMTYILSRLGYYADITSSWFIILEKASQDTKLNKDSTMWVWIPKSCSEGMIQNKFSKIHV